jgi:hypothetical protein
MRKNIFNISFLLMVISIASGTIPSYSVRKSNRLNISGNGQSKVKELEGKKAALNVIVATDKITYKEGEVIKLSASLLNIGEEAIFLYSYLSWGYSSTFTLHVIDIAGKDVPSESLDDSIAPPPKPNDKTIFIKLNPNHTFGVVRSIPLSELRINSPGKYRIKVKYRSPISARYAQGLIRIPYAQGLTIWSSEMGELDSNILQIEVVASS